MTSYGMNVQECVPSFWVALLRVLSSDHITEELLHVEEIRW